MRASFGPHTRKPVTSMPPDAPTGKSVGLSKIFTWRIWTARSPRPKSLSSERTWSVQLRPETTTSGTFFIGVFAPSA